MKKYLHLLALFVALVAAPSLAQASGSVTLNQGDLKKLVTTLKDDKSRKDFIDNLEVLAKTAPAAGTPAPATTEAAPAEAPKTDADAAAATAEKNIAPITQTLGVDSFTNHMIWKYQHFLVRNNLNESTVGKLILTGILLLFGGVLTLVLRRGATRILYWFDRAVAWLDLPAARMRIYARVLRSIVTVFLAGLILYTLTLIWSFDHNLSVDITHWFRTIMSSAINIVFVIVLATVSWEGLNALIELAFRRADGANSTRVKTIMPIVRNILFMVFAIMFTLMLLSELGINILPLMAGAGVVGVAIGFGAQTMVKDFLSGFTLILEDVMRVGDVVNVGGYGGVIEKITLRKVQLRDFDGSVYTVPFSEIKTVTNRTKDFSFYEINIGVAYKDDTDKVFEVMRRIDAEMRNDPAYKNDILEPIDIAGVDKFADSSVIIKARLKTLPIRQWFVGREYNRRLKKAFEAAGIEIPFPQQVTWNANPQVTVFRHDKNDPGSNPAIEG